MDRLEAMQIFVRVVETGSFSTVARERNSTQGAVSKQVAALDLLRTADLYGRPQFVKLSTDSPQSQVTALGRFCLEDDISYFGTK